MADFLACRPFFVNFCQTSARSQNDSFLEIEKLSKQYSDQFKVTFLISRPQGDCKFETGRVTKDLIQKYLPKPSQKTIVLICGPGPMVKQACLPNLESVGYQSDLIHVF